MSVLGTVVDELCVEDLRFVSDRELISDLEEIRRALDRLEAQFLRRVAEVDQRQAFAGDGVLSSTSLLVSTCRMAGSTAREKVRVARRLRDMPLTTDRFEQGDLTYSQVRVLAVAADTNPELFCRDESVLIDAAESTTVRDLRLLVDHWRQAADPADADRRWEAMHVQRRLYASRSFDGMGIVDGELDPEGFDVLVTALEAVTTSVARESGDAGASDDEPAPTAAQRRADGLVEICRHWLACNHEQTGGERPHVDLLVDLATLEDRAGRTCRLEHGGVVHPEAARRLACDAGLSRIVTDGPSQPLDVGRRTRTIPAAIRRALVVRDGGCRHPGCDRPASWCDAHHVVHWVDGGETSLANLVLLCRRHHRRVHEGGAALHAPRDTDRTMAAAAAR